MAGLFAHELIAKLVLEKVSKKAFISRYENVDDYFFGAIAPDIRYINNSSREITHKPQGKDSIFEAIKTSSTSMPFMADQKTSLASFLKDFKKTSIENCLESLEEHL